MLWVHFEELNSDDKDEQIKIVEKIRDFIFDDHYNMDHAHNSYIDVEKVLKASQIELINKDLKDTTKRQHFSHDFLTTKMGEMLIDTYFNIDSYQNYNWQTIFDENMSMIVDESLLFKWGYDCQNIKYYKNVRNDVKFEGRFLKGREGKPQGKML